MKIRIFLPFFTFLIFAFQQVIYCSEHDFEGWIWRKTLDFKLPNDGNHFINADVIHQKLANQVIELSPCLSKDGDSKKRNIAVLSLGVVLEDNGGNQCYTLLPCFDGYAFTSGIEKHPFPLNPEIIEKIKKYNLNDCPEYYLSLQEDIKIRKKRFGTLCLGDTTVIGKQNIPIFKKEDLIEIKHHEITGLPTLDGLGKLNRIKGRHTDSEQKMLCLIEESLTDFPGWVLYLLNTTNAFIATLEDYCSRVDTKRRYEIFSKKREILKLVKSQKDSEITENTYESLETIVKLEKDIKTIMESNDALAKKLYEATVEERLRTLLQGYDATESLIEDEDILILRSSFWSKIEEFIKLLEEDKGQHKKELGTEVRRLKSDIKRAWKGKFSFIIDTQKVIDMGKVVDKYDQTQQNKKQEIDEIYKGIVKKILESEPEPTSSNQNDEYLSDVKKVNEDLIPKISRILFDKSIKWDSIDLLYINESFLSIKALSDAVEDMVKLPALISSSDEELGYYFDIRDHIEKIKNGLLIRRSRMKGWLSSFHNFLERNDKKILGIVMHLHSYYDVCHFCGPSITRECEREDGIAAKLKHLCQNYNMDQTLPFFQVLFSCSEVRDHPEEGSRKDKYKDVHSDQTGFLIQIDPLIRKSIEDAREKEPVFFQSHIPTFQ